jgi:hypothetical protein
VKSLFQAALVASMMAPAMVIAQELDAGNDTRTSRAVEPATQYEISGATVMSPNETSWQLAKSSDVELDFVKKGTMLGETTVAGVGIVTVPSDASNAEYLQLIRSFGDEQNYGEDPDRFVLVSASEELTTFNKTPCIQFQRTFQDLVNPANDVVGPQYLKALGYYCRNPDHPAFGFEISYSNRSDEKDISSTLKNAADDFFKGVQLPIATAMQDYDAAIRAAEVGDFDTAIQILKPLAEQGDAQGQYSFGLLMLRGDGIPKAPSEAARWITLAAEQGDLNAQTLLGILYDRGEGVRADAERAMQWYLLAAEGGSNIAQTNLALGFRDGKGVPQNYGKAGLWLWISAENGSEIGLKWLENAQTNMSPEQFAEGQLRVRACIESFYKDCD